MPNPLLAEWTTPFGVPPFDQIKPEHYLPAFRAAMERHLAEVEADRRRPPKPTFANTIEALENSGLLLERVNLVLRQPGSAETSPELQAIDREVSPMLASHSDDITLNEKLFQRVKAVWESRAKLKLAPDQAKLLENTWKGFVRGGALLGPEQKDALPGHQHRAGQPGREVRRRRAESTNAFQLVVDVPADLAGLSEQVVQTAAADATRGRPRGQVAVHAAPHAGRPVLPRAGREPRAAPRVPAGLPRALQPTATRSTTGRWPAAPRRCGPSARSCSATGPTPTSCWTRAWPRRPDRVRGLLDQLWKPAVAVAEPRGGRPAGGDRGRRPGLRPRALGLVLLHGEGAQGALRPRRRRAAPVLRARARAPGRLRRGHEALRHHLHAR